MKLCINPEMNPEFIDGTYNISTSMLKYKSTHMFIASYNWDEIDIDIVPEVVPEDVRFFHTVSDNIKAYLRANPTDSDINKLCALYPDQAGALRLTYMQKGNLQKVVPNIVYNINH